MISDKDNKLVRNDQLIKLIDPLGSEAGDAEMDECSMLLALIFATFRAQ